MAKIKHETRLEKWERERRELLDSQYEFSAKINRDREESFLAAGGCPNCRGEGRSEFLYRLDVMNDLVWRDCDAEGCTLETRTATRPILAHPLRLSEREEFNKIDERRRELATLIHKERVETEPKVGYMVRVVKGRKLPHGDYQCIKAGHGQYGPWLLLRDTKGTETFVSYGNCIGLLECPKCGESGLRDDLLYSDKHDCCDRMRDEGKIGWDE